MPTTSRRGDLYLVYSTILSTIVVCFVYQSVPCSCLVCLCVCACILVSLVFVFRFPGVRRQCGHRLQEIARGTSVEQVRGIRTHVFLCPFSVSFSACVRDIWPLDLFRNADAEIPRRSGRKRPKKNRVCYFSRCVLSFAFPFAQTKIIYFLS